MKKLTAIEGQALSVVLAWQEGGWDNNDKLKRRMLILYELCKELHPDIVYGCDKEHPQSSNPQSGEQEG